jgi:Uncharacterised protein family (UPF0164)
MSTNLQLLNKLVGLTMNRKLYRYIYFLLLFLLVNIQAQTQNYRSNVSKRGTTAANFLEIGVSARALAIGSAFTALADDPSAIYWNAGGLAKLNRHGVIFNHTEWVADIRFDFIAATFSLGRYGAIGVSLTALTMDEMSVTTIQEPEGTGQIFRATDMAVSLAYAFRLTDRFSIGTNAKVIRQGIWDMRATGFAVDLGVHYLTPFKGLYLGMVITNFGTTMKMNGPNTMTLYDPDPLTTGNNGRIPAELQMGNWPLPLNFRLGLAYELFKNEIHRAYISADAQHPNNNYESVNVGAEYVFKSRLALRGGYRSLFLQDTEESLTLGAGIYYPIVGNVMFKFDFAYVDFGLLDNVYKYSVGIDF